MSQFWKINGYDGAQLVWERLIPAGILSEAEMIFLLQRLAARHLDDDEVVNSSLRKNAKGYLSHLEVRKSIGRKHALMTTGTGHHYTATIQEAVDA